MIITFDIESLDWNRIYAIGFYDGIATHVLADESKPNNYFIEWLLNELPDDSVVYAHNGGKFDFLFILKFMSDRGYKPYYFTLIHGSIVRFIIKYDHKKIEFRDSFTILPSSLRRLTYDFDVEHKKLEMDYTLGMKDSNFRAYFSNDLIGLYEVLAKSDWLTEKLTVASNAMQQFRRLYPIKMSANSYAVNNIFRNAYAGGRVEIFKMLGSSLNYYDINSLYPSVMFDFKYPLPVRNNYEFTDSFSNKHQGIYKCDVSIDHIDIPLLYYHYNGKLVFPIGKFSGWYTDAEIRKAKEIGYKVDVKSGFNFFDSDFIFREYVNEFYEIKRHSSGSKKAIAKLMLNSLYGKFGQRDTVMKYRINVAEKYKDVELYYKIGTFTIGSKKAKIHQDFMHSEIASMITANARLRLYSLFEKAKMQVYYCDTDSIITDAELPVSDKLGDVKMEDKIQKYIAIAPKVYAYITEHDNAPKSVLKAKGFRVDKLAFADYEAALFKHDYAAFKTDFEHIASFRESKVRHLEYSDKISVIKQLKSSYDKRIVLSDYTTVPLRINE